MVKIRIVFIHQFGGLGGAGTMLANIISGLDRSRFEPGVVAIADDPDGFVEAVRSMGDSPDRTGRRQEIARHNSWKARFLGALNDWPIASHSDD